MAKNETRRIRPSQLQEDRDSFAALKVMAGYTPANSDFTVAKIQISQQAMVDQRDVEAQQQAVLYGARDDATAAEGEFHNAILGSKAQFGEDSNELQALGLKKKSEYQSPGPRGTTTQPATTPPANA